MNSETVTEALHSPNNGQSLDGKTFISRCRDHFALTPLGIMSIITGAWVYETFGQREQDFLLYMMGSAFSLFALLIFFVSYIERWRLKRSLSTDTTHSEVEVEVGQDLLTGFSLPSIPQNPLFQLSCAWQSPSVSEYHLELFDGALQELVQPRRRGHIVEVTRLFTIEDLFGFTSLRWTVKQQCHLKIWPKRTASHELDLRRPQSGDELYDPSGESNGDLMELRRYADGDPLKWIMWRVYARNRQLVVRSPERALSERRDLVVYFISHPSDESSASTARAYLDAGMLGDEYLFVADGCQGAAKSEAEVMNHLLSSANGETLSALPSLLSLSEQQQRGVIIFASALTPFETLLKVINSLPSPPLVILSLSFEPESTESKESTWWSKLLKEELPKETLALDSLLKAKTTIKQLSMIREPILIAQPSSRPFSIDLLDDLTDL